MRKYVLKLSFVLFLILLLTLSLGREFPYGNSIPAAEAAAAKLNRTTENLYIGETCQLKLYNTRRKITWSSGKKSVAEVNAKGNVTAIKAGKATITAKAGSKKFTCNITVKSRLSVSKKEVTCADKKTVTVTFLGSGTVYYKNYNKQTVDCSWGKWKENACKLTITPKQCGTAKITLRNDINDEKITISVISTKDTSASVKGISNQSVSYNAEEKCHRIFFSFVDADKKYVTSAATVNMKIVNDNGETVYNKTREVTGDNFKSWRSAKYGTVLLCSLDIPDADITAGSSKTGKIYFSVSHGTVFQFEEYSYATTQLP